MEYLHLGDMFVNKLGQSCDVVANIPSELKYLIYNKYTNCLQYYRYTYLVVNNCLTYKYFNSDILSLQRVANELYMSGKVDFSIKER